MQTLLDSYHVYAPAYCLGANTKKKKEATPPQQQQLTRKNIRTSADFYHVYDEIIKMINDIKCVAVLTNSSTVDNFPLPFLLLFYELDAPPFCKHAQTHSPFAVFSQYVLKLNNVLYLLLLTLELHYEKLKRLTTAIENTHSVITAISI